MPVEFHRRGMALFYNLLAVFLAILAGAFLFGAIAECRAVESWSSKIHDVVEWSVGVVFWSVSARSVWGLARGFRYSLVRLTDDAIYLHTAGGKKFTIPFADIRAVDFNPAWRKRIMKIHTPGTVYTFDSSAIPRIAKIAEMLAGRTPQTLK